MLAPALQSSGVPVAEMKEVLFLRYQSTGEQIYLDLFFRRDFEDRAWRKPPESF
jgi:hypothetical protein